VRKHSFPSLREIASSAFQNGRRILIVMSLTLAVAVAAAVITRPSYMATSTLLVLLSPEYAYRPEAGAETFVNMALERDAILSSEVSILMGTKLQYEVVNKIGVERIYPEAAEAPSWVATTYHRLLGQRATRNPIDLAVAEFSKNLVAYPDKTGNTIQVGFRHKNPALAAEAVNDLVAAYLGVRESVYLDVQSDLVQKQVDQLKKDLSQASGELDRYQKEAGISDFSTQLDVLLRQQGDLSHQLLASQTAAADASQRVQTIKDQLAKTPVQIVQFSDDEGDRRVQPTQDALAALRQKETDLRQSYTDSSDKVIAVRNQIAAMQAEMSRLQASSKPSAVRKGLNETYATLDLDRLRAESALAAAMQQEIAIKQQLATIDETVSDLYGKKAGLEDRQRQKELLEQNYAAATKTLDERRLQENVEAKKATNVRVIQQAGAPLKSDGIRFVILAGGLIISVLLGLMTAFLSDVFRRGFTSPERLERALGLRVLSSISVSHRFQEICTLADDRGKWLSK
jgi:uncharacterized protein involved in exopolysaccharide biosynthesis